MDFRVGLVARDLIKAVISLSRWAICKTLRKTVLLVVYHVFSFYVFFCWPDSDVRQTDIYFSEECFGVDIRSGGVRQKLPPNSGGIFVLLL
jgi:hypothetical protein